MRGRSASARDGRRHGGCLLQERLRLAAYSAGGARRRRRAAASISLKRGHRTPVIGATRASPAAEVGRRLRRECTRRKQPRRPHGGPGLTAADAPRPKGARRGSLAPPSWSASYYDDDAAALRGSRGGDHSVAMRQPADDQQTDAATSQPTTSQPTLAPGNGRGSPSPTPSIPTGGEAHCGRGARGYSRSTTAHARFMSSDAASNSDTAYHPGAQADRLPRRAYYCFVAPWRYHRPASPLGRACTVRRPSTPSRS